MNIISLNALLEALKEGRDLTRVLISRTRTGSKMNQLKTLCHERGIVFQMVPQSTIDRRCGQKNQGVFAQMSPVRFHTLDEVMGIGFGLILILNGILDSGNLGAIIRTAVAANVDGILLPARKSAPVNETVLKTSAGALMHARLVISKSISNDIDALKKSGFWIVAADPSADIPYDRYDFRSKTALIVGNEARGVSPLLRKRCDQMITIPQNADIDSLNVSASTAVILFEALRQRRAAD